MASKHRRLLSPIFGTVLVMAVAVGTPLLVIQFSPPPPPVRPVAPVPEAVSRVEPFVYSRDPWRSHEHCDSSMLAALALHARATRSDFNQAARDVCDAMNAD